MVYKACSLYDEVLAESIAIKGKELTEELINASARVTRLARKQEDSIR